MPPGNSGDGPRLDGQDAALFIGSRRSDGAGRNGPLPRVKGTCPPSPDREAPGAPLCPQRRARHGRRHNKEDRRPVAPPPPMLPKAIGLNLALPEKDRYLRACRRPRLHHRSTINMKQTHLYRKHVVPASHEFAVIKM